MDPKWSFEIIQSFYLDKSRRRLRPNVRLINPNGMTVVCSTNSLGFKGPEIALGARPIAFWGDSVVFGYQMGWIGNADRFFPGFQFMNGGLEGDPLENIVERAIEINAKAKFDYNLLFPGWHSMLNPELESLLKSAAVRLPGAIFCTVPTSLNDAIVDLDLSRYFVASDDVDLRYSFWGNLEYSADAARKLLLDLRRQNDLVRRVASELGIPLVDFYARFYQEGISHFRDDFFDVGHPRPRSYPKWQEFLGEELKLELV